LERDLASVPLEQRADVILGSVAALGHRMTGPRRVLVEHVAARQDTFMAQEVFEHLVATGVPIGRATVFRTLDLLADLEVLHRLHTEGGAHIFTVCPERSHHHHLRCTSCGTVQALEAPGVEAEIVRLGASVGFEVLDHVVELVGRCARCR
jgi:Fe2+ or Zn2+ uptake regulation protein